MDPIVTPMLIMAAAGLAKNMLVDAPAAAQNRKLQAAAATYSPWTNIKPDMSNLGTPNPINSMMQGGMSGAMLGQNIEAAKQNQSLLQSQIDLNKNYGNYFAKSAGGAPGEESYMANLLPKAAPLTLPGPQAPAQSPWAGMASVGPGPGPGPGPGRSPSTGGGNSDILKQIEAKRQQIEDLLRQRGQWNQ